MGPNPKDEPLPPTELRRAERAARQLPPLWGNTAGEPWRPCATCGRRTASYWKDGERRVYICGPCAERELDEWEAAHS